ncbi:hypothetical protein U8527_16035 [Kordia algicida OT-1]|uniref:Uncharacterized protein n=1 Tax=Kordia algicida OT-1 TaxID=391587 RepID=A9E482_9FLAO|nr:hypothetical protein [Kordia algicida]EDP95331.1 hypothetical protein KAOT1_09671 [Kordia algicida OT-1]
MSSATLQAEVFINQTHDGRASSGYLELVSSENILIDSILADIHFEARGRMRGQKETLTTFPIIVEPTLVKAHEETILPFTFFLDDAPIQSYHGRNVSFSYTCEVTMQVHKDDFKKLGLSLFSSVKSFMTSDRRLRTLKKFDIKDTNSSFKVREGTYDFSLKKNYGISVILAFLLFLLYVLFVPEMNVAYLVLGIVVLIITTIITQALMESSLRKIAMKLEHEGDNFRCTVDKTKKFTLKEPTLFYEIIEKVTDRRGTKTSTSIETVYISERKSLNNFRKNAEFSFPYVNNPDLATLELDDVAIFWQMTITGTTSLGLKLKLTSKFPVKKEKLVDDKEALVTL